MSYLMFIFSTIITVVLAVDTSNVIQIITDKQTANPDIVMRNNTYNASIEYYRSSLPTFCHCKGITTIMCSCRANTKNDQIPLANILRNMDKKNTATIRLNHGNNCR
ncbi:unnamed protein product [Owenia fusiformis]|uniref:Uncharacterized protein n=1 Tax=Owenia fusiformis TaxID=6347 RepID=A0A8S4PSC9_OWEFU|nr:unnamed protein product [Owenia fusiformis]